MKVKSFLTHLLYTSRCQAAVWHSHCWPALPQWGGYCSPLPLPCQPAQPWLPAITLQDPAMCCLPSSASLITPQAAFILCCSSSKNIRNSLSRPPIISFILIMSPFIQFFAGSLPWFVPSFSWEGFFPHPLSSCWSETLRNLLSILQLLETCGSLKIKDWWMKCLSGVRMVLEFNLY